jgi:hypothetical protein
MYGEPNSVLPSNGQPVIVTSVKVNLNWVPHMMGIHQQKAKILLLVRSVHVL